MNRLPLRFVILLVGITSVAISDASAQIGFTTRRRELPPARFVEAPRYIQQELREAERAIGDDRMSDVVVGLGDLLQRDIADAAESDLAGQDFFLPQDGQQLNPIPVARNQRPQHRSISLLRRARSLLGELPNSALETYELRYGPLARKTLDEAAKTHDWEAVRDVRRKYFHTTAGFEASLLLAQHEMYGGHPLAASLLLDDVVVHPRAVNHLGNSVKMIHAAAMRLADRRLNDVKLPASGEFTINGSQVAWPAAAELVAFIDKRYATNQLQAGGEPSDYVMLGGTVDRNETSAGQMPLANKRWDLETTATPREARMLEKYAGELAASKKLAPPTLIPLRVGSLLLMRTTERIFGVDYRTGKRIWNYPWYPTDESVEDGDIPSVLSRGDEGISQLLAQRVWNDLPYGQITSDGQRVFFIDDLREIEPTSFSPIMGRRGTRPTNSATNTLVALDLPAEGKLQWQIGEGATRETNLSDAFFLGPPLPLDGRLYVMVESAGDILLICLDPLSGSEIWRQQLAAIELGGIDSDSSRRVAGATPTYHEGVLLCPTGAGVVVAVDLVDRMLRWGNSYARKVNLQRSISNRGQVADPSLMMERWHHAAAISSGNSVYMTPIESDELVSFDLLTGNRRFDRSRRDLRYLAGVRDGKAIVVSGTGVSALNAQTGVEIWRTDSDLLVAGQQIIGRGVFGAGDYLVPTSANQLIRVSLEDGSVLQRRNTKYSLGNLVAVDGEIISQGVTKLTVAYGEVSLEPIVNAKLSENPDDFEALVRKSELLIQRNMRPEALELLERAKAIDSESVEVQMLSVAAMLGMLRDDAEGSDELTDQLEQMIESPAQRGEFLSLKIRAALKQESYAQAADRLMELSSLLGTNPELGANTSDVINDATRQCELDAWIAARMSQIKESADEPDLVAISERVDEFAKRQVRGPKSVLMKVARQFGAFDLGSVNEKLTRILLTDQSYVEIERLAMGSNRGDLQELESLSESQLLMLYQSFAGGRLGDDAARVLAEIKRREIESDVIEPLEPFAVPANSPFWENKVALGWQTTQLNDTRLRITSSAHRVLPTRVTSGKSFQGWKLIGQSTVSLALRDPDGQLTGIPFHDSIGRDEGDREAMISGGVMIVARPGSLAAIDLYKIRTNQNVNSILWQRNFGGDGARIASRQSRHGKFGDPIYNYVLKAPRSTAVPGEFHVGPIMGDRVLLLQGGDLMAVSLASNDSSKTTSIQWRNSAAPPSGAVVSDGQRVAVVSPALDKVAFFDLIDGRKLGEEPWEHGDRWASSQQYILCYKPTANPLRYTIKLVDPFSGTVLQELESGIASRAIVSGEKAFGRIVDQRYMVLLNTAGKLNIWDLQTGEALSDLETQPLADLQSLHAMELRGQLIVIPGRSDRTPRSATETLSTRKGLSHHSADALYAVSVDDGRLRWSVQLDSTWGCTLAQPANTPLLLLTRSRASFLTNKTREMKLDVRAIDVRDGETLHERLGVSVPSRMNEIETRIVVQPVQGRLIAQIGSEILTYKFGFTDPESKEGEGDIEGDSDHNKTDDSEAATPPETNPLDGLFGE